MACRIPILQFEQYCTSDATIGFVLRIVATFALLFLLDTDIYVSNLFQYSENITYFCVLFAVLLPLDPSPNSQFLQHSMLNRSFRFRSVVLHLCHRISYGKLPWDKYEFTRFAHWTTSQMFRCFSKLQPVLMQQIRTLLRQSHSESNSVFRLRACRIIFVRSVVTRLFTFESLNPSVLPCRSLSLLDLYFDVFESIVVQQTLKVALHCHSRILIWLVEQCCVVFASTQCHIRLSKSSTVFDTRSGQM